MRVRRVVQDAFNEARDPSRNLFEVSSIFYRQTKAGGYGRPRRTFQKKILQELRNPRLILRYFKHFAWTATSWSLTTSNDDILVGGQAVVEGVMMRSPKGY